MRRLSVFLTRSRPSGSLPRRNSTSTFVSKTYMAHLRKIERLNGVRFPLLRPGERIIVGEASIQPIPIAIGGFANRSFKTHANCIRRIAGQRQPLCGCAALHATHHHIVYVERKLRHDSPFQVYRCGRDPGRRKGITPADHRFNRISANARTGRGRQKARPVRAFVICCPVLLVPARSKPKNNRPCVRDASAYSLRGGLLTAFRKNASKVRSRVRMLTTKNLKKIEKSPENK